MKRRDFVWNSGLAAGGILGTPWTASDLIAAATGGGQRIRWTKSNVSPLCSSVACDGVRLAMSELPRLLDASCRLWNTTHEQTKRLHPRQPSVQQGPLRVQLTHHIRESGGGLGEDLLEATLTIRNESDQPQQVELAFATSLQPSRATAQQQAYLPLNAAGLTGDKRFAPLGVTSFLKDCGQELGQGPFQCHYLEPMASYPDQRETKTLLLAPVVDISQTSQAWHVALFTPSDQPVRFHS